MKIRVLYESPDRVRVKIPLKQMSLQEADILEAYLCSLEGVDIAKVHEKTQCAVIEFHGDKETLLSKIREFDFHSCEITVPDHSSRQMQNEFQDKLFFLIARHYIKRWLLPAPLRIGLTIIQSIRFLWKGMLSLAKGKLEVPVLDATAISVAMLQGDFNTAGSIMFLLSFGELLEDWTYKKSVEDLAKQMVLNVDQVWIRAEETELLVPIHQVQPGDHVIVRTGNLIPLDGIVLSGEASVNQSTMTGESMPVSKGSGSLVYAGTVVEDGKIEYQVTNAAGGGRYDRIIELIEASEKLKSTTESQASHLADSLVPYSLGGTALAYLLTQNVQKAMAILMVDYSCALKLTMPIAVLSAMRDAGRHHVTVKGGKFLEQVAQARTIVFDKTGTITKAEPRVVGIIPFGGNNPKEMLSLAACLEEHYPHSIANAVVQAAKRANITHPERHSEVEYIVAHGIASSIDGKKVRIGSYHFIFEDEKCTVPAGDQERFDTLPEGNTFLYLAIDGQLSAILCIEDPIRPEAASVIKRLHTIGFDKVVMMTGDGQKTADSVAARVGVDEWFAEVLPEDKAAFIRKEHKDGRKVIMVGDGVNDAPALSEADVGVAIAAGAAIAREVADVMVLEDSLEGLIMLKELSIALMGRIHASYRRIMAFNTLLIALGFFGFLPPATTALFHNLSTLLFSMQNMKPLLTDQGKKK